MLFYRIEGICTQPINTEEDTPYENCKRARRIQKRAESFYEVGERHGFYFISDVGDTVVLGAITKERLVYRELYSFLASVHIGAENLEVKEVVLRTIDHLLSSADRQDYISSSQDIMERFGLEKIRSSRFFQYGDRILEVSNRDKIESESKMLLINDSFLPELNRIYSMNKKNAAFGHPVHYMVETDDRDLRKKTYTLLLQALYEENRIDSKRITFFDIDPADEFDDFAVDCLYRSCIGGALVARFTNTSDAGDSNYVSGGEQCIEKLCKIVKRYRNQVLTVICLPKECAKVKETIFCELGSISVVEIKEEFADGEKAKDYLKLIAKENHTRTDKNLFNRIEPDKKYLAPELHTIYDEWYSEKLKTSYFPSYASFSGQKKVVAKKKPTGNAYDELQQMIGLEEAKQVIGKALNFYKAQKLFKDKGIKQDRVALHMVFTGNPGTAKTSVARLFAKIMTDNGLLSKGTFIEVGRADIVGKYVGWTAKIVQEKFAQARGGVLFIDEAYSLCQEDSGSYGDEAINTIVQEMENHREDVVVIFAGYPDKMEEFLNRNPGLRSRIAFHVPFSDYNTEELCKIAEHISKKCGLDLTAEAKAKLKGIFEAAKQQSDFGNGRYARNVIENARMTQANRIMALEFDDVTSKVISTLTADDIVEVKVSNKESKKQIGFSIDAA